jgi:phenylpropionate dioxygenase-like ring-hydroxylating dioxygenase large terminal subunit
MSHQATSSLNLLATEDKALGAQSPEQWVHRDGALIDNWYIACTSAELKKNKPLSRTLYDTSLVLFRQTNGQAVALQDRCLHRHAQLSKGTVCDGQISCPYHGWRYDEDGKVTQIPSELEAPGEAATSGEATFEKLRYPSVRVKKYLTAEQDDCVWVWMGATEPTLRSPPYRFPYWKQKSWTSYFMVTDFDGDVTNLVENFMDVPHTVFVHKGWFRNAQRSCVPIEVLTQHGQVLVTYKQKSDNIGFTSRILNPKNEPVHHTDLFVMPNITRVDYSFGSKRGFVISSQCTPVGYFRTRVYTEISYQLGFFGKLLKPFFRFYTRQVILQDVKIMKNQAENLKKQTDSHFISRAADILHLHIEKLRKLGTVSDDKSRTFSAKEDVKIWI